MKKEILVIFKTHLDIGYTDLAANVIDKYLHTYIPRAIKVARELEGTDTPFVWTVGSWMINEALKYDRDGSVEAAVRDGLLSWHGLPFTSHTELMSKKLFEYGLAISRRLDKRFGKKTVGAKMTDVPGHTAAMVPLMADAGLRFLHIGVNAASPLPDVPPVFRWRHEGREIVVMYEDGYGHGRDFGDFVVFFAHTNDNLGPQSAEEITAIYEKIRREYPDAEVRAADLNDVAEKMLTLKELPVVEAEIGDTWIHGSATDPKKIGMYRELLRHIDENGIDVDLEDSLLLVPEHTCGVSGQTYFPNRKDWLAPEMDAKELTQARSKIESSWDEQREYIRRASELLGVEVDYKLEEPALHGYEKTDVLSGLEIVWELFDRNDITRYIHKYLTVNAENMVWAGWDYTKPGLPDYKGGSFSARCVSAFRKDKRYIYKLEFDSDIAKKYSLPLFYVICEGDSIEVDMIGKGNCRLPQAFWLKFKGHREAWIVEKLGSHIDPENTLGSPLIMAVGRYVENPDVRIYPIDSCLVAPFGRRLYDYDTAPKGQDLWFNLYNNIWNTNFPLWYSDDTRYRFRIEKK